jgi:uncharacterized protein (DUF885 family)
LAVFKGNNFGKKLATMQPDLFANDRGMNMELRVDKALSGMTGSLEDHVERIKAEGYQVVEAPVPKKEDEANFRTLFQEFGLLYLARVFLARTILCLALMLGAGCQTKQQESAAPPSSSPAFATFVDEYFNALFDWSPARGTAAGLHQYDTKLENFAASAVEQRIRTLKNLHARLATLRANQLTPDEAVDGEILDGQMRSELLELETLQTWRKNPMDYVMLPGFAVDGLVKRDFAPPVERLKSVVSRLKAVPPLLQAMRDNIINPPKEFTALALRLAGGSVGFFRGAIADWAKQAASSDAALLNEFETANQAVVQALETASTWLQKDLTPKSKGAYAIGAENFSKKLLYEEMVDLPLDKLLAIGESNLERDYHHFLATARQIHPAKPPAEVMKSISDNHPSEDSLIPSAKETIESIRRFILDKRIITIPSEVRPTVMETPPYARAGSFAAMDTPGPYEARATEAFYYVTPTEKDWDAKHKEEHLRAFNAPVMDITTIHEAYPGHYTQFLYAKQFPTKTRKLVFCGTNVEGWAHYAEQMTVEEGFGSGDPKVRLAQLEEALLRDCRYVVGIKLHTQGMSVEDGARFFVEKGLQEPANAYEEARRGTYNPTYLYYTLGKLQIYKLREDYRKAKGAEYSLQTFHNEFAKQGGIPVKLVRRILLPGDQGPVL